MGNANQSLFTRSINRPAQRWGHWCCVVVGTHGVITCPHHRARSFSTCTGAHTAFTFFQPPELGRLDAAVTRTPRRRPSQSGLCQQWCTLNRFSYKIKKIMHRGNKGNYCFMQLISYICVVVCIVCILYVHTVYMLYIHV